MSRRFARLLVALVAAALASPALPSAPALAGGSSCTSSGATVTVTATGVPPAVLVVNGGAIWFDGAPCQGAPTVTSTDMIVATVNGPQLDVDLSGGPFAPGATNEGDGSSEIEFQVDVVAGSVAVEGSAGADHVTAGTDSASGDTLVALNADEATPDADVTVTNSPSFLVVLGRDGDDTLSLAGDPAWADGPLAIEAVVRGGGGSDTIGCALNGSDLAGGSGEDALDCSWPAGGIDADLGHGKVRPIGGGTADSVASIEDVLGSAAADVITGDGGANLLQGVGGDDTLQGDGGADVLDGGPGEDTASYAGSSRRIDADLANGTATGAGPDTFVGIEDLQGSPKDDHLFGDAAPNVLSGDQGDDRIKGRAGDDHLYGQGGNDVLDGGEGTDVCRGGPGSNLYRNC